MKGGKDTDLFQRRKKPVPPAWSGVVKSVGRRQGRPDLRVGFSESGGQAPQGERGAPGAQHLTRPPPTIAAQRPFDPVDVGWGASKNSGVRWGEGDPVAQPFPGSLISHSHESAWLALPTWASWE